MISLVLVGVDYYPEQWDRSLWDDDIRTMASMGVNVVRLGEFAWSRLEPSDGVFDFSWLDEAIDLIVGAGMKVILGTPTNCAPRWLYEEHPDVLQCERDGSRTHVGIRGHRCMTSPTFRFYATRVVELLAERYALRPEVMGWQIDNEVESSHCTCPSCSQRFRDWVREKHGTLAQLNRDWGCAMWSGDYTSWDQVTPLVTSPVNKSDWFNPAYVLDYERFCSDMTAEFVAFQRDIIKRRNPAALITTNACFGAHLQNFYDEFRALDVAAYDNYPPAKLPRTVEEPYSNAFALDFVRGFKNRNFWIMEQLGGPMGCWAPIRPAMEPGMLEGYALQAVAHGADLVGFFRWRTATAGAEMFCYGLFNHDNQPNLRTAELERLIRRLRALPDLDRTTLESAVAIVYSPDSSFAFETQAQSEGFTYGAQMRMIHDVLAGLGVNVDIIEDRHPFDGYRLLIVPACAVMTDELAGRIKAFVRAGGCALVTTRSAVKDENGNCVLGEVLPAKLSEMCGCHVIETDAIGNEWQQVRTMRGENYRVTSWCDILSCDAAQPVMEYAERFYSGQPAASVNRYGEGLAFYVGTIGDRSFYRALLVGVLEEAKIPCITTFPPGVESCVRSGEGGTYRFFFNNTMEPQKLHVDSIGIVMKPLEVKILDGDGEWR